VRSAPAGERVQHWPNRLGLADAQAQGPASRRIPCRQLSARGTLASYRAAPTSAVGLGLPTAGQARPAGAGAGTPGLLQGPPQAICARGSERAVWIALAIVTSGVSPQRSVNAKSGSALTTTAKPRLSCSNCTGCRTAPSCCSVGAAATSVLFGLQRRTSCGLLAPRSATPPGHFLCCAICCPCCAGKDVSMGGAGGAAVVWASRRR
jgi:hypothetical protein